MDEMNETIPTPLPEDRPTEAPLKPPTVVRSQWGFGRGIIITLLLVVLVGAVAWKFGLLHISSIPSKEVVGLPVASIAPSPLASEVPDSSSTTASITWFNTAKPISGLNLLKSQANLPSDVAYYLTDSAKYSQLAEFSDHTKLIKVEVGVDAPGGNLVLKCLVPQIGPPQCLKLGLDQWSIEYIPKILESGAPLTDSPIEGLIAPDKIKVNGIDLVRTQVTSNEFKSLSNPVLLGETTFGSVYTNVTSISEASNIGTRGIYLRLKDNSLVVYAPLQSPLNGSKALEITWTPKQNSVSFSQHVVSGCGSLLIGSEPIYIGKESLENILIQVGVSSTGQPMFATNQISSGILKSVYALYLLGREGSSDLMSIEQFAQMQSHVLWKDPLGDWQVFVNDSYLPAAECGKPVIYLYPQVKTKVSVAVGAHVLKSEPLYPNDGWRVEAFPNGTLQMGGSSYSSLYWEGTGFGLYPDYRHLGVVVNQTNLISTLTHQLGLLGLTSKEQVDFMEFWRPRLPQTPYVRLTWLGTRDMDLLAPLTVSPQPDTTIRIFLEFEGLTQFKQLIPQRLTAPLRRGFTLVEWGGLLIREK